MIARSPCVNGCQGCSLVTVRGRGRQWHAHPRVAGIGSRAAWRPHGSRGCQRPCAASQQDDAPTQLQEVVQAAEDTGEVVKSNVAQLLGMKGAGAETNKWKIRLQLTKPVTWVPLIWGVLCGAAASGQFTWTPDNVAKSIVCMIMSGPLLTGYTQTINDYYDRELDAINEPYRPIPSGAISETEVVVQFLTLLAAGLGVSYGLDRWAGHETPTLFYLAVFGSIVSYIYSAPPLKLKQSGWIGNYALGSSYIALPWLAGQALFGQLSWDVTILTVLYSIAGLGIAIVNDFKSIEGDKAMGMQSLPVAFGVDTAKWICAASIDVTQLSVAAYLFAGLHENIYAAVLLALVLPQIFFQAKYFLPDPIKNDVKYQASAQPFLVFGLLTTGLAARRQFARTANKLAARILSEPRSCRSQPVCASAHEQSQHLATDIVQKLPAASVAALVASLSLAQPNVAVAAEFYQPPSQSQTATQQAEKPQTMDFQGNKSVTAPAVTGGTESGLPEGNQWRYSEFINAVQSGKVERVRFAKDGTQLQLTAVDGRRALVVLPNDPDLVDILAKNGVDISVSEGEQQGNYVALLGNLLFPLIAFGGLFFLFRGAGGQGGAGGPGGFGGLGGGGPMDFGRNKSKFQEVPETGVTFDDVAGVEGAKLELAEVVDFLKNPDKYTSLGAKIPKGCLLVGPPGTGKTLLAKAIAGEAGVPFFSCAASEFVELFVGVGASRVRDLFEKAKAKAPCIVFIDEIDAVGRQRGAGMGGGNDEREQTINQLLTEMDGFEGNTGVIVLAATNRPDVLDQALLRPGRFDRQVTVDRPDVQGRIAILKVHSRGKTLAPDVDFEKVARRTPGFTGADLQNLMNEAAILAARRELKEISKEEIADALERIVAGPEKKGAVMSEQKKKLVAYHEAGHALVGALMPEYDPVQKISIVPRGSAGGLTFFAPSEERLESGLYSKTYLENQLSVALGGRVAEEIIFGEDDVTTGASSDFMQVARIAKMMVTQMGMSEKLGQVAWSNSGGPSFLGAQMGQSGDCSMATTDMIDAEVKEIVERAYRRSKDLITTNIDVLHNTARVLMEREQIDGDEFQRILVQNSVQQYLKQDAPDVQVPYQDATVAA